MKLYSVTARWHEKRQRRDWIKRAIIMAENKEAAVEIFKKNVSRAYPENAIVSAWEITDGIYTMAVEKSL